MKVDAVPNKPHGRRPPEKAGRAGHGGTPLYYKSRHQFERARIKWKVKEDNLNYS